ncbi:hypothetical protein KGF57_005329 [Candida theae]|uniref:Protein BIG1 n=1 Tax=Candida theae TaxID=1198502 RepID=A0AAD5FWA8_9ASCO|nr:uncharacterized protein KGF57_005329 [Candida theae]KAI5948718.1 hypothetical protein KGF57_005329 [Candida theae]
MHFSSLLIAHLAYFIGTIAAFANTAPTFIRTRYDAPGLVDKPQWLYKTFSDVDILISTEFKAHDLGEVSEAPLNYYQVRKSEWFSKSRNVGGKLLPIANVVYSDRTEPVFNEFKSRGALPKLLSGAAIDEALERANTDDHDDYVIQIIPDHKEKETDVVDAAAEEKLQNLYDLNDKVTRKEKNGDVSVEQDIDADFAEANRLAAEEDQPVSILEDIPSNSTTVKHDNLFTNYQFFTTGIWSGLIVSGFLLLILYGALTWLSDLQITYASFEKQVDFDKKNE